MKYQFEKSLKIINELMSYLHKLGANDINVNLKKDDSTTIFIIWGKIDYIDETEINNLHTTLNMNRQHEVEEYYWHLGGEEESNEELSLIGMMIDEVEIDYSNNILTLKIYRKD